MRFEPLSLSDLRRSLADQASRDQESCELRHADYNPAPEPAEPVQETTPAITEPTDPGIRWVFGLNNPKEEHAVGKVA